MLRRSIKNMVRQYPEWVKNYTTAHLKLREPIKIGCENNE